LLFFCSILLLLLLFLAQCYCFCSSCFRMVFLLLVFCKCGRSYPNSSF
jgi:hypothetical protein